MYEQKEYLLAYLMVFAFLILGMLIVCIPRPRKKAFLDPETAVKEKRKAQAEKKKKKAEKKTEKKKKKRAKAVVKKAKNK